MPTSNHRPLRTCLGCRTVDRKDKMVRIAARGDGVALDLAARLEGRGGYLHPTPECLERFVGAKVAQFHSLKRKLDRRERLDLVNMLKTRLASFATLE